MKFWQLYFRLRRKISNLAGHKLAEDYWTNRYRTRMLIPILRRSFDPGIPPHVQVETTTDCNYNCPFCPQSVSRRPARYITREGFQFLLERLKPLNYSAPINLAVNCEPFLHPLIVDFAAMISDQLPHAQTLIVTNGSLIKDAQLDAFSSLAHPPVLYVNDYTANRSVTRRIERWKLQHPDTGILFQLRPRSLNEQLTNRAGNMPVPDAGKGADYRDVICTWPFYCMFIRADMKAFFCCSDYYHEMILGDLNQQGLMDIWNGPAYREIREHMLNTCRAKIPLCAQCDDARFSLPDHCMKRPLPKAFF